MRRCSQGHAEVFFAYDHCPACRLRVQVEHAQRVFIRLGGCVRSALAIINEALEIAAPTWREANRR